MLLTAAIWGFAFVAQRAGMTYMGPFTFNAVRFLLGGSTLLGVACLFKKQLKFGGEDKIYKSRTLFLGGIFTGLVLFGGASLQQMGLVGTTAGKAGFITGLYVVLVPIMGLLIGRKTSWLNWTGAVLAVIGLYLLSVREGFSISPYDLVVLMGAMLWAVHVHLIAYFSPKVGALRLAIFQFLVCGILSLSAAIIFENPALEGLRNGWLPLLYGSFLSVGLAHTLQIVVQRKTAPSHAAIIMSLESMFAALGGWLILGESLGERGLLGAGLMLAGMLVSQLR
ncbi:MAG: DMT family transporter [Chloroflexota bacterium]